MMAPARRLRLALADGEVARQLGGEGRLRVLDAGCGDGLLSLAMAKHHPTWSLIGVDLRESALDGARRRAVARGLPNVRFVPGNLEAPLPLQDCDAVLAVEAASELTGAPRVAVSGVSQGGGLALAAAALVPQAVAICHADVPFLCDIQRGITLAPEAPYNEIPEFLAHNVDLIPAALDTLRYVDCALLARRITARCLLSVGLMDTICPPSTVFAAYNEIAAGKDIAVHPFTGHQVPTAHVERQLRHLRDFLR